MQWQRFFLTKSASKYFSFTAVPNQYVMLTVCTSTIGKFQQKTRERKTISISLYAFLATTIAKSNCKWQSTKRTFARGLWYNVVMSYA